MSALELTPGSSRCVLNLIDKMPSGTSKSPSSGDTPYVAIMRSLSFRLSELRRGAEVLIPFKGFLNMILQFYDAARQKRLGG